MFWILTILTRSLTHLLPSICVGSALGPHACAKQERAQHIVPVSSNSVRHTRTQLEPDADAVFAPAQASASFMPFYFDEYFLIRTMPFDARMHTFRTRILLHIFSLPRCLSHSHQWSAAVSIYDFIAFSTASCTHRRGKMKTFNVRRLRIQ